MFLGQEFNDGDIVRVRLKTEEQLDIVMINMDDYDKFSFYTAEFWGFLGTEIDCIYNQESGLKFHGVVIPQFICDEIISGYINWAEVEDGAHLNVMLLSPYEIGYKDLYNINSNGNLTSTDNKTIYNIPIDNFYQKNVEIIFNKESNSFCLRGYNQKLPLDLIKKINNPVKSTPKTPNKYKKLRLPISRTALIFKEDGKMQLGTLSIKKKDALFLLRKLAIEYNYLEEE